MKHFGKVSLRIVENQLGYGEDMWMTPLEYSAETIKRVPYKYQPNRQSNEFTVEDTRQDASITLLDTFVTPKQNRTLSISIYRKPTHTNLYLQWESHHHIAAKCSLINTQAHRSQSVCSTP